MSNCSIYIIRMINEFSEEQVGGEVMSEFIGQKVHLEGLRLICAFCDKYKNEAGYWEKEYEYYKTVTETRISHGLCPECFRDHYPDEYLSLRKEGRIVIKEIVMPNNKVLYGCFVYD
jgi:hypothetical protein